MYREPENPTFAFIDAFVDELARSGMQHAVICPGSRSTPLAYSFARNGNIKIWILMDERSASFFALGMAKASRKPVALLCTSGTAAANFLPAVVEANISRVPLVVLTADRPHELRDNGAPQAIDQIHLFGNYVKWFADTLLPEATNEGLRYARTLAGRAIGTAAAKPVGPVHLNFPLREPLIPVPIEGQPLPPLETRELTAWQGRPNNAPYVSLSQAPRNLTHAETGQLTTALADTVRGVIICGPMDEPRLPEAVSKLAAKLNWPILADPLSGVRSGNHYKSLVIDNYDAFLRDEATAARLRPEIVLRFGAMPTCKPVLLWLKKYSECRQIIIDGGDGWQEPTQLAEEIIHADPRLACLAIVDEFWSNHRLHTAERKEWAELWQQTAELTSEAINEQMAQIHEPFEGKVFAELEALLPDGSTLFVGNSMPVRDLDTFFPATDKNIRLLCNRGANGIDGVISSALGVGAVTNGPLVLVIGDLSFYHDMNGLLAAKLYKLNATIILLNNDGGGIFSFLPQASYGENFEQLFGTPHGLNFAPTAELYGGTYAKVEDWGSFQKAVKHSLGQPGLNIIEVPTKRDSNVTLHRRFWPAVAQKMKAGV